MHRVLGAIALVSALGAANRPPAVADDARELLASMARAADGIRDYTVTVVRRVWREDALGPEERLFVKWARPDRTYVKRMSPPGEGREVLWVPGRNRDRLRATLGVWPNIDLNVDPFGRLALRDEYHPIDESSLVYLVETVIENFEKADRRREARAWIEGEESILGRPCDRLHMEGPAGGTFEISRPGETVRDLAARLGVAVSTLLHANRDKRWKSVYDLDPGETVFVPGYYASRIEVWVDRETRLPLRVAIWDHEGRLFEQFEHRELTINPGLGDADFSPDNPAYGF